MGAKEESDHLIRLATTETDPVLKIMALLIAHHQIGHSGKCICGHEVHIGEFFTRHQAEALIEAGVGV